MAERISSMTFGDGNRGVQVGQSNAPIQATFNLPPEPLEQTPLPFASIPFSRDPIFVDRGDILDQIGRQCSEPFSRVAIYGLGGVGKSQLAIEFAYRFAARLAEAWVFWIHASTQARVIEGFMSIADKLKLPGRNRPETNLLKLVYEWLSNERNGKWLLVLDSADDSDVFLKKASEGNNDERKLIEYLPHSQNGSILITTRNRDLAFRLAGPHESVHEVGPMTQEEAMRLLENRLGTLSDANAAADLVRSLDLVPLAISQAAAYIRMRQPRTSLERYLGEFRQSESKRAWLLSNDAGDLRRDLRQDGGASNAILITWQVSFDEIRSKDPSAADLLSLMSFFNRQGIPESLLKSSKDSHGTAPLTDYDQKSDSDSQVSGDETENEFEDDVKTLRDYCLITQGQDAGTFEMHELVQLATRRWLKTHRLRDKFLEQFITIMDDSFPLGEYENWTQCRPLFAHVEAAADYRPNEESIKQAWSHLLYNGGWYAFSQGRYTVAEQMNLKSSNTLQKLLGGRHQATLSSEAALVSIYYEQGRWKEAEKLGVHVMEACEKNPGEDHGLALFCMDNLARIYSVHGRWEEVRKLQVQVLEAYKLRVGPDHLDTLRSMNNLARTYQKQDRLDEAEELQVQVLAALKLKLGEDHPHTLLTIGDLATTYLEQGRLEKARKLQVQVVEAQKSKLGEDHPHTLSTMGYLAITYLKQGRLEKARKLQVQVVEAQKLKLGEDHPDTLVIMNNLAITYQKQDRLDEAEELQVQVLAAQKLKLGEDYLGNLVIMNNLALTYFRERRLEEARNLLVQVIEARKLKLGENHPDTLDSIAGLAIIEVKMGNAAIPSPDQV
ncbi:kinesin light chain [Fusarium longipes]|uniref:Kinesin light chain n=1 Tax=Fusarium longipes TaxID=694270 RepID=A0A395T142_9HYPO|nr:kinesin light chain [Fusarium longipes]